MAGKKALNSLQSRPLAQDLKQDADNRNFAGRHVEPDATAPLHKSQVVFTQQIQDDQQPQQATRVTDAPAQAETAKVIPLSPEEEVRHAHCFAACASWPIRRAMPSDRFVQVQVKDTAASFRRRNNKKQ